MFEFIFAAYAKFMTWIATGIGPNESMDISTWTTYVCTYHMYKDAAPVVFALTIAVTVVAIIVAAVIIKHEVNANA